jgi:hypothetical protein
VYSTLVFEGTHVYSTYILYISNTERAKCEVYFSPAVIDGLAISSGNKSAER